MIKIDTRYKETLIFDTATTGVPQPSEVIYRLFLAISEGFSIVLKGVYDAGELIFTIPPLKDLVNVQDKQQVPFHIEALIDDYTQTIMEREMEFMNLPKVTIDKMTHVKNEEVKEEVKKPIQIKEKIEIKEPSKFAKSFEVFITQGEEK